MWADIKANYRAAFAFAFACPLLFLIPAMIEFAQHVIEIKLGMYQSFAAFQIASASNERLGMGLVKVAAAQLPGWWFIRYLGFDQSRQAARHIEPRAFKLWLVIFGVGLGIAALSLFGPSAGQILGLPKKAGQILSGVLQLAYFVFSIYLSAWVVAWPLGNSAIGPIRSIRLMAGHAWRTLGYYMAGFLPLVVIHYAVGLGAIGRPIVLAWAMLIVDALVVAMLALTMTGGIWLGAVHAASAKGISLTPSVANDQ